MPKPKTIPRGRGRPPEERYEYTILVGWVDEYQMLQCRYYHVEARNPGEAELSVMRQFEVEDDSDVELDGDLVDTLPVVLEVFPGYLDGLHANPTPLEP